MTKMTVLVMLVWAFVPTASASRWCYKCGLGYGEEPDCTTFVNSGSWIAFRQEFPDDYLCVKVVNAWNTSDESKALRGGARGSTVSGFPHKVGCWSNKKSYVLTCYCDTNFCNDAPALLSPSRDLAHTTIIIVLLSLLLVLSTFTSRL
ncbi:uncharacterized protein LOC143018204 [Oratosquilla oratoria]|uniref:uncharacterized protein LOC143018204 n=1 Tax=Oratosquilla oratoria TaxID=337810 RepID=UPI003F7673C0